MRRFLWLAGLPMVAACVPAATQTPQPLSKDRAPVSQPTSAPAFATIAPPRSASLPILADLKLIGEAQQGGILRGRLPAGVASLVLGEIAISSDAEGHFFMAFDRDAPSLITLTVQMTDGRTHGLPISVAPGNWRIEHINAPIRGSATSSTDFQRRRAGELTQIRDARAVSVTSNGWLQNFIWPVTGRFSGFFGAQRIYQGVASSYHSGTDVAVPAGTPFVAPAEGVVVLATQSPFTLEGNLLIVAHGMGLTSAFLHCQRLDVKVGDAVRQGQRLGTVGATGRATGPHMHWGVMWNGQRLNPGNFVPDNGRAG